MPFILKMRSALFSPGLLSLALLLTLIGTSACKSYQMDAPRDFVVFDREDDFKAISADGVRLIAREIPNRPKGDLALWTRAVLLQMDRQGYTIAKNEAVRASTGQDGRLIGSTYLIRNVPYSYWTAIFVKEDTIVLIESAAPADKFKKHESSVRQAIRGLRL